MDIRCSREETKCDGCPIMEECEKVELTEEVDLFKIYNKALDDFRKKINNFLHDSSDFADFVVTDSAIDCVIDELKK